MTANTRAAPGPDERVPRPRLELIVGFACIFAGLWLAGGRLEATSVSVYARLGGALLPSSLGSGVELAFRVSPGPDHEAWSLPLVVTPPPPQPPLTIPIETRTLLFLPTICFIALAVAAPLGSWRKNLALLGVGLLLLEPLLVGLAAVPILSFLGGTGPVRAFDLGLATHTALQLVYRALVVPPGMAFAIPLLVWWTLVKALGLRAASAPANV